MERGLLDKMKALRTESSWEPPVEFDLSRVKDQIDFENLIDEGGVNQIDDQAEMVARDLFLVNHPDLAHDKNQEDEFARGIMAQGESFGRWFYFPWEKRIIRYPSQEDLFAMRTARNKNIITDEEQRKLGSSTIALYGLSVGSSIATGLVQSGVGSTYVIGDFDTITPTNLNRMSATVEDIGSSKVDYVAKVISKTDPYIRQVHDRCGYTPGSLALLDTYTPDLLIEEVDNLSAKALMRQYASTRHVPLIMATDLGKKSIIDIELHNKERVKPFLGKVSARLYESLLHGEYSAAQETKAKSQIVGLKNVSTRMVRSVMDIGRTTTGNPQLRHVVTLSESLAVEAAAGILLDRVKKSGSHGVSLPGVLRERSPDSLKMVLRTWRDFADYIRR